MTPRAKKETLAFIVADFYDNRDKQERFYRRFADEVSGFVGVLHFLVLAADAFIFWESRMTNEWDGEFPQATEDYADRLLNLTKIPTREELRRMAKLVLSNHGARF